MTKPAKNTICLWYDSDAEEAARFYANVSRFICACGALVRREIIHPAKKEMC